MIHTKPSCNPVASIVYFDMYIHVAIIAPVAGVQGQDAVDYFPYIAEDEETRLWDLADQKRMR